MTDERATIERLAEVARDDPGDVPVDELAAGLESQEGSVRERAATALHAVSMEHAHRLTDAVPRLAALLESDRVTLRNKALATLANVGAQRADLLVPHVDAILALLDDDSPTVNRSATRALSAVANVHPSALTPAVPRLVALLDSDVESTRAYAATVLAYVADEEPGAVRPAVEPLLDVVEDAFEPVTGITYDPKMSAGRSGPTEQMRGFRALTADPDGRSANAAARESATATLATLADDDPAEIADALDDHLPRLFDLLDDRNPAVRGRIAGVLASVAEANPDAVRPAEDDLIDALDDPTLVGQNAVRALAAIGTERARDAVRDLALDETADDDLRATAERALENRRN